MKKLLPLTLAALIATSGTVFAAQGVSAEKQATEKVVTEKAAEAVKEVKAEAKEVKEEAKAEVKEEAKAEAKEVKEEAKVEAKEVKEEAKAEAKEEAKAEVKEVKEEAKAEAKEVKEEAKAEVKEEAKAAPPTANVLANGKEKAFEAYNIKGNVLVNGKEKLFEAYNIKGNNYFKLRDIASVLNGTKKQFAVEWDAENNAIVLVKGKAYTAAGGEMLVGKDVATKKAVKTDSKIILDGVEVSLTVYNIGGNNYFKLRDLGEKCEFDVNWNEANKTVEIKAEDEAPATEAPATETPATEAPATETPATEAPATEAPATETPATETPATETPATETPAGQA